LKTAATLIAIAAATSLVACGGGGSRPLQGDASHPKQTRSTAADTGTSTAAAVAPKATHNAADTRTRGRDRPVARPVPAPPVAGGGAIELQGAQAKAVLRKLLKQSPRHAPAPKTNGSPAAELLQALTKGGAQPKHAPKPTKNSSSSPLDVLGLSGSKK
jgi:hypothetical protein